MTSLLPEEEESNVTRLKQKSQSHGAQPVTKSCTAFSGHDETRSFLDFSRENLSISHSDLEQGFQKPWRLRCCSRQTFLSCAALLLALSCAGLELWKLRRVMANARDIRAVERDIETVKRDVETLKHRFLEKDLLDDLRSFEEQLYGEGTSEESEDLSSNGLSNEYDSSYDDSSSSSSSSPADYDGHRHVTSSPESSSAVVGGAKIAATTAAASTPCTSKDLENVAALLRRAEADGVRERERLLGEERDKEQRRLINGEKSDGDKTKRDLEGVLRSRKFFTRLKHPPKE